VLPNRCTYIRPALITLLVSNGFAYRTTMVQARFTEALMKDKAKLDFSADRIFSTAETGQPKSDVLKQLEQKHPGTSYHFVEDKLGTLDKVLLKHSAWCCTNQCRPCTVCPSHDIEFKGHKSIQPCLRMRTPWCRPVQVHILAGS